MASYRVLMPEEIPTALTLWVDVFGVEAAFFQSLLDSADPDDVSLGAFEGDKLVSSVHVFMRWLRNSEGTPLKVGGIGSVSTLPEARGKGHSSRLLQMAIHEMEERGCVWSGLGTGVNDHYAKQGWRTISVPAFRGNLRQDLAGHAVSRSVVDSDLLTAMARVHDVYSSNRPLFNARSSSHWQHSALYRTTAPTDSVYTVTEANQLAAYIACRESGDEVTLAEAACLPGKESCLSDLIKDCLTSASTRGIRTVRYELPEDSGVFPAFADSCSETWPTEDRSWMTRPIFQPNQLGRSDGPPRIDPRGQRSLTSTTFNALSGTLIWAITPESLRLL